MPTERRTGLKFKIPSLIAGIALLIAATVVPLQADELSDAMDQQEQINNQHQAVQGQLKDVTYTSDRLEKDIKSLDTQIASATDSLKQRENEYAEAQIKVTVAQKKLEENEQQLAERQQALGQRLKGIYESGQVSYLEVLFQSADLGDFISRLEYFGVLIDNDQKLLSDIKDHRALIEADKVALEAQRDQAAQKQQAAALAKSDLDAKQNEQQAKLDENEKLKAELYQQAVALEEESNKMTDLIKQIQRSRNGGTTGTVSYWPLPGYYEISSPFGYRIHPITKLKSLHTGVDIPAPTGTGIRAAGAGEVIFAGWNSAYGYMTIIDHGGSYSTLYGHQSRLGVSKGDIVEANQVIGYVGTTGWSTGPHLHFEVRIDGTPTDPLPYVR